MQGNRPKEPNRRHGVSKGEAEGGEVMDVPKRSKRYRDAEGFVKLDHLWWMFHARFPRKQGPLYLYRNGASDFKSRTRLM